MTIVITTSSTEHRNLSMHQVSSSTTFFFSYMHIYVPFIMYCSRLFVVVVVFQEMNCLHTIKHDDVRRVAELHLSCLSVFRLVSYVIISRSRL